MAVDADGNEIGQRCDQSLDSPFDPCQGQSDSPPVSLQEQQVTSSDSLRGQSAIPPVPVPGQQVDSDGEETAFFAAEPFVIDQERDERVWATLDEGCNAACHSASWAARAEQYFDMFGFQSEYRVGTRTIFFSQDLVATRLPQLDVASYRLHLLSLLNVAASITCQAPLNLGSCLVMDLSCSRSMHRPS